MNYYRISKQRVTELLKCASELNGKNLCRAVEQLCAETKEPGYYKKCKKIITQ